MAETKQQPRNILLGITGGIAAYKSAELVRLLTKQGHSVQVVMTAAACEFITPVTMQALSGNPVYTDLWQSQSGNGMQHIEQARAADAILIAPTSADFMAKLALGIADDLLSTLCLARDCPLLIAPAMNQQMWQNRATQRNLQQLIEDGIVILGPADGEQACGETGLGRMLEPELISDEVTAHFTDKLLINKNILITAGATLEMIDPVRGITNLSSGKMGYALAKVASHMGANVTLVSGVSHEPKPNHVNFIQASDAATMHQLVMDNIAQQDIMIGVAAVADYSPAQQHAHKIKKSGDSDTLTLNLKQNRDIIADVASLPNPPFCVGFAAETENLTTYANKKRLEKKLPMIVANLVSESMGLSDAQLTVITDQGTTAIDQADKVTLAHRLLTHIHQTIGNA